MSQVATMSRYRPPAWQPKPPAIPVECDVIVPFCANDSRFLQESIDSLLAQQHAKLHLHVIADGCDFPHIAFPENTSCYSTDGDWGPYRITNAVVAGDNLKSDHIALHDADDVAEPSRIWRQIRTLMWYSAEMISSAMSQFVDAADSGNTELQLRAKLHPRLMPGTRYDSCPRGQCVNSTRTMTRGLFERMNGFANLTCSMDFDFDNRARCSGVSIVDDSTVLAKRRLHSRSMTNGPFRPNSAGRSLCNAFVFETLDQLRTGDMSVAFRRGGLGDVKILTPVSRSTKQQHADG